LGAAAVVPLVDGILQQAAAAVLPTKNTAADAAWGSAAVVVVVGAIAGRLLSAPLNAILGRSFRLFNVAFNYVTDFYHALWDGPPHQRAGVGGLRRAAWPDLLGLHPVPLRVHSMQDKATCW